jgi:hypothetical protein
MTNAIQNKFYIKYFQQEIDEITHYIQVFNKSGHRDDEAFLEIGNILVRTQREKNIDEHIFKRLKTHVAKLIGRRGLRHVHKLVCIAQCDVLQNYKEQLPKDWYLLYVLSQTENLEELLESGEIGMLLRCSCKTIVF